MDKENVIDTHTHSCSLNNTSLKLYGSTHMPIFFNKYIKIHVKTIMCQTCIEGDHLSLYRYKVILNIKLNVSFLAVLQLCFQRITLFYSISVCLSHVSAYHQKCFVNVTVFSTLCCKYDLYCMAQKCYKDSFISVQCYCIKAIISIAQGNHKAITLLLIHYQSLPL